MVKMSVTKLILWDSCVQIPAWALIMNFILALVDCMAC